MERLRRLATQLQPAAAPTAGYRPSTPASNNGMYGPEGLPFATPLDIRKGLTTADSVNHKLNWGIISASAIASDWIKCLQVKETLWFCPISCCFATLTARATQPAHGALLISLQDVPGATVTACAARDHERAKMYAEDHGIATAHGSYEELCADPAVDIVYIGTKTADHHAHMLMAIAAGKHVLCEKPFTDTAAQAREVYAAAAAKGLFCQEGMWVRYFPAYEHAKAAIELGVSE